MKKIITVFSVVFCLILAGTGFANSQACCENTLTTNIISVTGQAFDTIAPDTVNITIEAETKDKTLKQASELNNKKISTVISSLKSQINPSQGDYVKTTSYNVFPQYEYDRTSKKNVFTGYVVKNQITVKTKNIAKTGEIIDKAISNGADRVQNLNFTLEDKQPYCNPLLEKASKSAYGEAQVVANSLGVKLNGISKISSSCYSESQGHVMYRGLAELASDAASGTPTPVEAGEIKIRAEVRVDFYIK
jgi:uncharacterized protein YggE